MEKYLYIFILLFTLEIVKSQEKTEVKLEYMERDEITDKNEQMKRLVKNYIQSKNWELEKEITIEEFKQMFTNVIQKSFLKQYHTEILTRFAENTIKRYGEPIIVKNLENYFEPNELQKIYLKLYNPIDTDL